MLIKRILNVYYKNGMEDIKEKDGWNNCITSCPIFIEEWSVNIFMIEGLRQNRSENIKGPIIENYRKACIHAFYKIFPRLTESEIAEAVDYSIEKSIKSPRVTIDNNYTRKNAEMDLLDVANQILEGKPIVTTQGVLFRRHGTVKNPFYNFIQYLVDKRDEAKKQMKKYPKGSEQFNAWNQMQLNYKVSCNALYGCTGNWSSIFYNLYLCTAVTGQGRGCISASITMFESFLSNNIKFASLTEVLQFIENVDQDMKKPEMNRFNDCDILDRNISIEECFLKIINTCGYNNWVPSDEAVHAIWNTINNLDQRTINVLYYKNNLYRFCSNSKISSLILGILCKLKKPFLDPNSLPEEVKDDLILLKDILYEYVYYRHIYIDKLNRVYSMMRDVVLITDTDSCIISLDEWYRFVLEKTIGIPMAIKYTEVELKKQADKIVEEYKYAEPTQEYDFYNDKLVEAKRLEYPTVVIEEDGLRFSIVNTMSYVVSQLILDYMVLFSENYNTKTDGRDCLLIMKNEFLFKCIFLTDGAKNYADLQLIQEGCIIPEDKQLDIKGLQLVKVGTPEATQKELQKILEYDILRKSFIDQVDIFKKFVVLEKKIYQSIKNKDKEYHKPARLKTLSSYKNPMSIQGIKASVVYNEVKDENEESINLEELNTVLIIKTSINKKNSDLIMNNFPEHYIRLKKLLERKEFKDGISSIAIPINIQIPDWIIPFIDYNTIIQDNLKIFPLEFIGLSKADSKYVTHSNIVQF